MNIQNRFLEEILERFYILIKQPEENYFQFTSLIKDKNGKLKINQEEVDEISYLNYIMSKNSYPIKSIRIGEIHYGNPFQSKKHSTYVSLKNKYSTQKDNRYSIPRFSTSLHLDGDLRSKIWYIPFSELRNFDSLSLQISGIDIEDIPNCSISNFNYFRKQFFKKLNPDGEKGLLCRSSLDELELS